MTLYFRETAAILLAVLLIEALEFKGLLLLRLRVGLTPDGLVAEKIRLEHLVPRDGRLWFLWWRSDAAGDAETAGAGGPGAWRVSVGQRFRE